MRRKDWPGPEMDLAIKKESHKGVAMKTKLHPDVWIGIAALCFSSFFLIKALSFPQGPNVFPIITLSFMILCAAIIAAQGFKKTRAAARASEELEQFAPFPFGIWAAMGLYCLLFWICGYAIATLVFMAAAMWILKIRSWKTIGLLAVGYLAITYFVFVVQFGTPIDGFGLIGDYLMRM